MLKSLLNSILMHTTKLLGRGDCMNYVIVRSEDYLAHHGVKGQRWGIRRYQNEDGSLTAEGREKYGQQGWEARQMYKRGTISKDQYKQAKKAGNIIGKIDNVMSLGFGRRMREFQDRHKKGLTAASAVLGTLGGAIAVTAAGIATGGALPAMAAVGASVVPSILAGTVGSAIGNYVVNPLMLKYGYNSKITGEGFKSTKPDYQNKG